jgi:hypothetical protein
LVIKVQKQEKIGDEEGLKEAGTFYGEKFYVFFFSLKVSVKKSAKPLNYFLKIVLYKPKIFDERRGKINFREDKVVKIQN